MDKTTSRGKRNVEGAHTEARPDRPAASSHFPQGNHASETPIRRVEKSLWQAFRTAPPGIGKKELAQRVADQIRQDLTGNDTFDTLARDLADELGERAVNLVAQEEAAITDLFRRVIDLPPEGRPQHLLATEGAQIVKNIETTLSRLQYRYKEYQPEFWALKVAGEAAHFAWHAIEGDLDTIRKRFDFLKLAVEDCELDLEQLYALNEGKVPPLTRHERPRRGETED